MDDSKVLFYTIRKYEGVNGTSYNDICAVVHESPATVVAFTNAEFYGWSIRTYRINKANVRGRLKTFEEADALSKAIDAITKDCRERVAEINQRKADAIDALFKEEISDAA